MTAGNLSGHPTVSSGYNSGNAEHNGKANEKIPDDIAQIQKAAARYSYCTYDSIDNVCNDGNLMIKQGRSVPIGSYRQAGPASVHCSFDF